MMNLKLIGLVSKLNAVKLAVIAAAFLIAAGVALNANISSAATPNRTRKKPKLRLPTHQKCFSHHGCANCHAGGDGPTQGDAMKPHDPEMLRGKDGHGTEDLQCNACHMDTNTEGDVPVPGVPDWHMPPADHKMVITGLTPGQLCLQIKDPLKNGGLKTPQDSIKHMDSDPKVLWAWTPGNKRTIPPMSHEDFMKKMNEWVANGAACPD